MNQRPIAGGHLHGGHSVGKSSQRTGQLIVPGIQSGKFHGFQTGKALLRRHLLQQIPGNGIFRSLHRIPQRNVSFIITSGIRGPFFCFYVLHYGIRIILALQGRSIHNQRLNGAAGLAEALIRPVQGITGKILIPSAYNRFYKSCMIVNADCRTL